MEVREAAPEDARAVGDAHQRAIAELGPQAYTDEQVDAWRGDREPSGYELDLAGRFVVAEKEGIVVGFGTLDPDPGEDYDPPVDAEVTGVYVHPGHAREGVGSALLADLERTAREWNVERVGLHASLNAVPFYEAKGYERVRERPHEFAGGVEGTVVEMHKHP